jgi:hypothetical protein
MTENLAIIGPPMAKRPAATRRRTTATRWTPSISPVSSSLSISKSSRLAMRFPRTPRVKLISSPEQTLNQPLAGKITRITTPYPGIRARRQDLSQVRFCGKFFTVAGGHLAKIRIMVEI